MSKRRVIIELRHNPDLEAIAFATGAEAPTTMDAGAVPRLQGLKLDTSFVAAAIPGQVPREQSKHPYDTAALFDLALEPQQATFIVRGEAEERALEDLAKSRSVAGVFSDPEIQPELVCPGDPAVGTDADVERLLCATTMRRCGMDGLGVLVAIVDTGFNLAYLNAHGKTPTFDPTRSWVPRPGLVPGQLPVNHGTMCAFDVCIAAPKCTLLDIALLQSTAGGPNIMSGLLSDAVRAYSHLLAVMNAPRRPGEARSLVVNNSWGMFHPSWDFPVGTPGNYSDNPNHPFNRIVATLERAGADILFAAGNCGANCPDGRCQGVTTNAIYGANGHAAVLSVAGVDVTKTRVGYSTIGPGRLTRMKPDICGYTHFRGSGVYPADGGTSAATPVVTGVVAAVRTKRPFDPAQPQTQPAAIRALVTSTAEDLGTAGYDFEHGHGVINGCALAKKLCPPERAPFDICKIYPWLPFCHQIPIDICKRYPWLCRGVPRPRIPVPPVPPGPEVPVSGEAMTASEATSESGYKTDSPEAAPSGELNPVEMAYAMGYFEGRAAQQPAPKAGCQCGQTS